MELFSEIYSCYYQVMRHILCRQNALSIQDIYNQINSEGFGESMISIIPKLESGAWNLFDRDGELYLSKLSPSFTVPLSALEKSYLKALLSDPRIGLFLDREQTDALNEMLVSVEPLWRQEQFCCYDRFTDGDPYPVTSKLHHTAANESQASTHNTDLTRANTDESDTIQERYRQNFRTLLKAQKRKAYVELDYTSPAGTRVHHYYVPARLEYSVKNDKFRLLALKTSGHGRMRLDILNVARIQRVRLTDKTLTSDIDLNSLIRNSYYKEPLTLHIVNKRNALERAMLHFANYEKNTAKIGENTYECLIYYNQNMETELLIEVMSFGPMLKVIGNEKFLKSLQSRLEKQRMLIYTQRAHRNTCP